MAILKLSSGDVNGFRVLFALLILYGLMSCVVYFTVHMKFVRPLGVDAPLDRFSEARAIQHVRVLAEEIGVRQVSRASPLFRSVICWVWSGYMHVALFFFSVFLFLEDWNMYI